jgi:hypothetical protein
MVSDGGDDNDDDNEVGYDCLLTSDCKFNVYNHPFISLVPK